MQAGALNSKVPWGAGGAAGGGFLGYQLGAAASDLVSTILISGLGWPLTEKNQESIETIITAITVMVLAFLVSFAAGYFRPSGLTVEQQEADLEVAKAIARIAEKPAVREAEARGRREGEEAAKSAQPAEPAEKVTVEVENVEVQNLNIPKK